jgi:hypothetical protein
MTSLLHCKISCNQNSMILLPTAWYHYSTARYPLSRLHGATPPPPPPTWDHSLTLHIISQNTPVTKDFP